MVGNQAGHRCRDHCAEGRPDHHGKAGAQKYPAGTQLQACNCGCHSHYCIVQGFPVAVVCHFPGKVCQENDTILWLACFMPLYGGAAALLLQAGGPKPRAGDGDDD